MPYVARHIDLRRGEQRRPEFVALNPAAKVPVMIESADVRTPLVLSQSNAIMLSAAEKAPGSLLLHDDPALRAIALERYFYFVTDVIGPGHAGFF